MPSLVTVTIISLFAISCVKARELIDLNDPIQYNERQIHDTFRTYANQIYQTSHSNSVCFLLPFPAYCR